MIQRLDVVELAESAFGAFGIALAPAPDAGGGRGQDLALIPIVVEDWLDEREVCREVQAFVTGPVSQALPDFEHCESFRSGRCVRAGRKCAFLEAADAELWGNARRWRRYRDGWLWDPPEGESGEVG